VLHGHRAGPRGGRGTSHTLTGTVTFTMGGTHLPVTATLKFTS
jgi:hypothetical protein